MKLQYYIHMPSELSAGLRGFSDTVTIEIESGDPGGAKGEFEKFMGENLASWYDGARVTGGEVKESEK